MAACDSAGPSSPSSLSTVEQLIAALQQQGATVIRGETLPRQSNPFFATNGQILVVNGGNISVFEYPSEAAAARDASMVSPSNCSIGSTQITWIAPPQFYRKGPLIVIYAGNEPAVLQPLGRALGDPFARC